MSKLVFHKHPDNDSLSRERALRYASLPFAQKLNELFALIDLAIKTNGNKPFKKPRGAGIVLNKIK